MSDEGHISRFASIGLDGGLPDVRFRDTTLIATRRAEPRSQGPGTQEDIGDAAVPLLERDDGPDK